ncbi:MAG: GMP synthase [Amphritea sp.]
MKIAILQCDDVLDKFQEEFGNYPQMVTDLLMSVDDAREVDVFDVRSGEYPNDIDDWNLFITTGSKASVYDDEVWIKDLIGFVQCLDKAGKKLIGICFGHQIIALATGGAVENSRKGWGIGVASNRILTQQVWMGQVPAELNLIVSHQDQVTKLSEGAAVIAESDFCPYFMVQWNAHFLSVQGHPEWSRAYSETLINDRRDRIAHERIEDGLASLAKEPDNNLFSRWILNFASHTG